MMKHKGAMGDQKQISTLAQLKKNKQNSLDGNMARDF